MHKGQAGRVAIIAGSRGMSGAAVLCGLGALRGGAGLVRVFCPADIQPIVAASEPCLMTVSIDAEQAANPEMAGLLEAQMYDWASAVAIGPGLDVDALALNNVVDIIEHCPCPLVLDADALNAISSLHEWFGSEGDMAYFLRWWERRPDRQSIITPHPGEMARLRAAAGFPATKFDDEESRIAVACEYARLSRVTAIMKGHRTIVCEPPSDAHGPCRIFINTTGNPGMATGGMGDVLTGLIAALIGQGMPPFDACCLAVHAHGLAGDRLAKRIGPVGFLAREVADELPAALAAASQPRMGFL